MSLLVRYTLASAEDHTHQVDAMQALVASLTAENITGLHYSCFETDEPTQFIGVLEFPDDATKQAFLDSPSFAAYRAAVGPTFATPPQTTQITAIASTRRG